MTNQYRYLKLASTLIWSGVALLLLGILVSYPTFYPYFDTLLCTSGLPTAPLITAVDPEVAAPILPFAEEDYSVAEALEPDPPTPIPTEVFVTPTSAAAVVSPIPTPSGVAPVHIRIPAIDLDAPVIPLGWQLVDSQPMWMVPDWKAVGWHNTSVPLGVVGNTVLNGHNTTRGEVFRDLYKLKPGNLILVEGDNGTVFAYKVADVYILQEAGQPLEVRLENARYIQPTLDERLTLVTCHPYGSTRYRLIVIAFPMPESELMSLEGE